MNTIVSMMVLASLWFGCASSTPDGYPADLSVQYDAVSRVMRRETSVRLSGGRLYLHHESQQMKEPIDDSYALASGELQDLQRLLRQIDFHALQIPKPDRVLDAPDVSITASYDGKTRRIEFGRVKDLPKGLAQCRSALFELATKYDKRMKNILGY